MAIPTVPVGTANCDAPTDVPATWRADALDLTNKFNELIAALGAGGTPADAAVLRAALDATTTGNALITAADAAAVRTAAGATTTGNALITAADAAAARSAIGAAAVTGVGPLFYASSAFQTIDSNIEAKVAWSGVSLDTASGWNAGLSRYVVPVTGYYRAYARLKFAISTGASRISRTAISFKNAASADWAYLAPFQENAGVTVATTEELEFTGLFTAGDVIEVWGLAQQDSNNGASWRFTITSGSAFSVQFLGT